jgi:hypothetical protein
MALGDRSKRAAVDAVERLINGKSAHVADLGGKRRA